MLELIAQQYLDKHQLHIVILKQHDSDHNSAAIIDEIFGKKVNIIILPEQTNGPADTVYQALTVSDIKCSHGFLVHDCDSKFTHDELVPSNKVFVASLADYPTVRNPANKSYVNTNDQGIIVSIIEKTIASDTFCIGGYQFDSAESYKAAYQELMGNRAHEIYLSTMIDTMIAQGIVFLAEPGKDFYDLGTKDDWKKFNDHPTIFCDIDGTIIENQTSSGTNSYGTQPIILQQNVKKLRHALLNDCQIIFTTSRPELWRTVTQKLLDDLGFAECTLIMGLHHSRRILINDYATTNPYPSAIAINLKRNTDDLNDLLDL